MKTVIFACVHNAGRSQMAAAFFNKYADPTEARAISAGTNPAKHVHPEVLAVMNEIGLDLSTAQPTLLTEDLAKDANLLITMGCGENCPYVPGLRVEDWGLQDPKGKDLESVRAIRDQIKKFVEKLISNM
ncbi:MAG: arsenate reductase ArsC [Bdellovibrionales bacterium]|nr:arsenate reductase ArsC [Bdellovibrionales bacterium]